MNQKKLPHHWGSVALGNCCVVQNGFPFKSELFDKERGIPLIRVRSLKAQTCDINFKGEFDEAYLVSDGDILIGMDGDFQPCYWEGGKALLNQRVCRLVNFSAEVEPYYIFQAIKEPLKQIEDSTYYTTVKHLSSYKVRQIAIPLPPLLEQRAIAHSLRTVQETREARRKELQLERERKAALMQHLFTHGTRDDARKQTEIGEMPESWRVEKLGGIAEVAYGLTVNESRRKGVNSAPYLTVANVTRGALRLDEVKRIGMLEGDSESFRVRKGDVLLVEGNGNPKLLGSAAVWNDELPFVLHQNHLIRARPNQSVVLPEWVMNYINSDEGRAQLLGKAKTSSGLHSINSRLISSIRIPLPPLTDQSAITGVTQACNVRIGALEKELVLLDELFRALLEELMTGGLSAVPLIEQE